MSIGGSGGIFAPSLFTGAAAGMAFGTVAQHIFGHTVSSPALFAVIAMGGVFGAAAQAPLTAMASVVEMTGNFALILPVMLATGIAAAASKRLSYGSIYTTKLLRRGIDISRPRVSTFLESVSVNDVMQHMSDGAFSSPPDTKEQRSDRPTVQGTVIQRSKPQSLMVDESLEQAMRQLAIYGPLGLPVLSADRLHLVGWITRGDVLSALAKRIDLTNAEAEPAALAAQTGADDPLSAVETPPDPLEGYDIVRMGIDNDVGRPLSELRLPRASRLVALVRDGELQVPQSEDVLHSGDDLVLLVASSQIKLRQTIENRNPVMTNATSLNALQRENILLRAFFRQIEKSRGESVDERYEYGNAAKQILRHVQFVSQHSLTLQPPSQRGPVESGPSTTRI